jgi:hypothetical protein
VTPTIGSALKSSGTVQYLNLRPFTPIYVTPDSAQTRPTYTSWLTPNNKPPGNTWPRNLYKLSKSFHIFHLKYIQVKTQLYSITYTRGDMFRLVKSHHQDNHPIISKVYQVTVHIFGSQNFRKVITRR